MATSNDIGKRSQRKKGTRLQFDRAFRPVALEIGRLARDWNQLQEELGQIFAKLIAPDQTFIALAAWHSQKSDLAQRNMLRATASAWYPRHRSPYSTDLKNSVVTLLNAVDEFSIRRNTAVHAPIVQLMDVKTFEFRIEPNHWYGNTFAKRLRGKDVLTEFRWYVGQTQVLRNYAMRINAHLISGRLPLPSKLVLPPLSQYQTQTSLPRQTSPKRLRPPPQS
jgi:hypothetical protein